MTKYRVTREPVVQPQDDSIKFIPLTKGRVAIVDASDYPRLSVFNWHVTLSGGDGLIYARRCENGRYVYMHRDILECTSPDIDHANGNGLDNRRINIRPSTRSQNNANWQRGKRAASGYRGVHYNRGSWEVSIQVRKTRIRKTGFRDKFAAARFYNQLSREHFGEFGYQNQLPPADI
jgi:hypothetical protein